MFRTAVRATLVVVAAGAVVTVSAMLASSAAAAAPPSMIRLVSVTTSESTIDVPPKKASAGDRQLFTSRLLNAQAQFGKKKGAVVGTDRGTMRLTSATIARLTVVAKLPGGTITVGGNLSAVGGGAVSIPIVGGTGTFAGARGTLTILAPTGPKTVVNIYRLVYAPVA